MSASQSHAARAPIAPPAAHQSSADHTAVMLAAKAERKSNAEIALELTVILGREVTRKNVSDRLRKLADKGIRTVEDYERYKTNPPLSRKQVEEVQRRSKAVSSSVSVPAPAPAKPGADLMAGREEPVFFAAHISPKWHNAAEQNQARLSAQEKIDKCQAGEAKARRKGVDIEQQKRDSIAEFMARVDRGDARIKECPPGGAETFQQPTAGVFARPGVYRHES